MYSKFFLFISLFLLVVEPNNEITMTWSESQKLSWTDFKSAPNPNSHAVALTASGITFGYTLKTTSTNQIVDFSATVEAHFYPKKSWYVKDRANLYILAHEQLHFDITELYARKFRKELAKLKTNKNLKKELKNLHNTINKSLNETQKRYDAESNHSINLEAQKRWETFVNLELEKLSQYKS